MFSKENSFWTFNSHGSLFRHGPNPSLRLCLTIGHYSVLRSICPVAAIKLLKDLSRHKPMKAEAFLQAATTSTTTITL